jgi:ubiquinone biosynthesis protein
LKRYSEIAYILIKYGFSFIVERLNLTGIANKIPIFESPDSIQNLTTGQRMKAAIEELGPTYIKLGQVLSTRRDLFDKDILDEISKLRDDTKKFPTEEAIKIFEEEIGQKIVDVFSYFNEEPIAAASIGQVYEARLRNGQNVIVKIQKPHIEKTIKSDIDILKTVAVAVSDLKKDLNLDLMDIVEQFETQILRELDYSFEAINANRFKKMFESSEEVYIPDIYTEYCTRKVLVLEKIEGIKLSEIDAIKSKGWNCTKIVNIGVRSFFIQVLKHCFFHADPHPGNIFVVSQDKISYIDFGMIGIVDKKTLKFLNQIAMAVSEKNVDKIIFLLTDIEAMPHNININSFRQDFLYLIHYYYNISLKNITATEILNEIFRYIRKYNIVLPNQLVILLKTLITLEGTARYLNPEFSLDELTKEFLVHYYKNIMNVKGLAMESKENIEDVILNVKSIPKQLKSILSNIERNNIKINVEDVKATRLENVIREFTYQMSMILVLAALIIGSSTIISSEIAYQNKYIRWLAITGFFVSFAIGIVLVIRRVRDKFKGK